MTESAIEPSPNETELRGNWIPASDGLLVDDATERRIECLVNGYFEHLADDWTGWESLYRDPRDGRLWELTYPHGEMHGGGPRLLRAVSRDQVAGKYASAAI